MEGDVVELGGFLEGLVMWRSLISDPQGRAADDTGYTTALLSTMFLYTNPISLRGLSAH